MLNNENNNIGHNLPQVNVQYERLLWMAHFRMVQNPNIFQRLPWRLLSIKHLQSSDMCIN